jgi:hypothetical protein
MEIEANLTQVDLVAHRHHAQLNRDLALALGPARGQTQGRGEAWPTGSRTRSAHTSCRWTGTHGDLRRHTLRTELLRLTLLPDPTRRPPTLAEGSPRPTKFPD